jgi:membrane protease YdiL (CAAX protease family)
VKVTRGAPKGILSATGLLVLLAFALWYVVFVVPAGSFWLKISVASALLAAGSLWAMGARRKTLAGFRWVDLLLGALSAAILYGVFALGRWALVAILPGAASDIGSVYAPRGALPLALIGALLFLVTGPAEEVFWRGMVQHTLSERIGTVPAIAVSSLCYGLVHACTGNLPLVLAALAAGVFWGCLYAWTGRVATVAISHSIWSLAVFVVFPMA